MVGASVAGLATACALTERGWSTALLERRPDLAEGGRAILLQPNGLAALDRIGALESVAERGHRLERVVFYNRDHEAVSTWRWGVLRHPHPYAIEIRPRDLRAALAERLEALGGEAPMLSCEFVGLAGDGDGAAGARFRDRAGEIRELDASCVVGADGPRSAVRDALGIAARYRGGTTRYLLGTVDVEGTGEELAVHLGAGYGDGVVPLGDGTYFWDVVTEENRVAADSHDLDGWRSVFGHRMPPGSPLPEAVTSWDQLTEVEAGPFWTPKQVADGAALAGDAAGVVHPHSGQGANLALEDAVALGEALAGYRDAAPVPASALASYGRSRHRRRRRFVAQSLFQAGVLDGPNPAWRTIRAVSLASNRVPGMVRLTLKRGST